MNPLEKIIEISEKEGQPRKIVEKQYLKAFNHISQDRTIANFSEVARKALHMTETYFRAYHPKRTQYANNQERCQRTKI